MLQETLGLPVNPALWTLGDRGAYSRIPMKLVFLPLSSLRLAATATCGLFAVSALAQDPAPGAPAAPAAAAPAARPLSPTEKNFIRNSGKALTYLVALAEAGKHSAVKEDKHVRFRDKAITDLKKALEGLKKTASERGETVETELAASEKSGIERLGKQKDERFVKQWIEEVANETKKLDRDFQSAERSLQDPDLKTFVSGYTPMVRTVFAAAETQEKELKKK